MNSNRGRVLDAKPVTHSNSARVNFANRKKNEDSFAKTPARAWVFRVGPLSREWVVAWAALVCAHALLWWAEPLRESGCAVEYVFKFRVKYKRLFN